MIVDDLEFLRHLELVGETGVRYRHRGVWGAPEEYASRLWAGVLHQAVAVDSASMEPIGLLACFAADFRNGHAEIAFVFSEERLATGATAEAGGQFIDYLFEVFPFRKLYGEVLEFNAGPFQSSIGPVAQIEGRRRAHEWHDGEYWDRLTLAVHRDVWRQYRRARFEEHPALRSALELLRDAGADEQDNSTAPLSDLALDSLAVAELADLAEECTASTWDIETLLTMTVGQLLAMLRTSGIDEDTLKSPAVHIAGARLGSSQQRPGTSGG